MMKFLYSTALVLVSAHCIGQGLVNQTNLWIESGATVYAKGAFDNDNTVHNRGTLTVAENFNNSGTSQIGGRVVLDGAIDQSVSGYTRFTGVLEIDNSGQLATANGLVEIDSILRLNSGEMNANNNVVIRSTSGGTGLVDDFSQIGYNGRLSGNLKVQRFISGSSGFHYFGSAVNNASVSELSEIGLYGPDGAQIIPHPLCLSTVVAAGSPYGAMFEWREAGPWPVSGCNQSGWYVRSSGQLTNARGYAVIANQGQTLEVGGSVGNTSEISTITYSGLANTNPTGDGWHLVSNPFPSPMIWSAPPAGFDAQAHFWQTSGGYAGTYQPILPSPGALIASQQGFFVKVSGGPASFALPQSYRSLGDPPFYKEDLTNTFDIIVEAKNGGFKDKTRVRFGDNGETNGFDNMLDANKLKARGAQPTLKTRFRGVDYSINSLSLEDYPMTIPMDLIPGVSGEFEFTAEYLDQFDVEAHVYLEDLKKGLIQELTVNPVYKFTANESDDAERFLLHFRLGGDEPLYTGEDLLMYAHDGNAYLFIPELNGSAQLEVFNAIGALVHQTSNLNEGKNEINLQGLASGTYILRALVNGEAVTRKVIL